MSMSSTSIEMFRKEEEIRISFLKHRGDILAIVADTGYDIQSVKRVVAKIKKKQYRDVDRLVANDIAQTILSGVEQRERSYLGCLNELEGRTTAKVSLCHGAPVKEHTFDGASYHVCLQCGETCEIKVVEQTQIYKLVLQFNKQLREEAEFLVEFAVKMGYTDKIEPPSNKITQYNFVVPDGKTKDDILSDVDKLTGPERQQLRRKLEQQIIDTKFEDDIDAKK
ncbi:MAG: hypothetical protein ACTSUP_07930 [Candidatus Heimdallarchaeaceae archaeon]